MNLWRIYQGHIEFITNQDSQKIQSDWALIFLPECIHFRMKMIFQNGTIQNVKIYISKWYSKVHVKINKNRDSQKIQLNSDLIFVIRMVWLLYENNIPGWQIKMNKNQDSQKIQLDWSSIFVARIQRFLCKNNIPVGKSKLLKIGIRTKYNWIGPQYLYPECKSYNMKMIFQWKQSRLIKITMRKKYNWIGPQYLYPECKIPYEN